MRTVFLVTTIAFMMSCSKSDITGREEGDQAQVQQQDDTTDEDYEESGPDFGPGLGP